MKLFPIKDSKTNKGIQQGFVCFSEIFKKVSDADEYVQKHTKYKDFREANKENPGFYRFVDASSRLPSQKFGFDEFGNLYFLSKFDYHYFIQQRILSFKNQIIKRNNSMPFDNQCTEQELFIDLNDIDKTSNLLFWDENDINQHIQDLGVYNELKRLFNYGQYL